tara:strand:+ start:550 stop:726 length:177 start_codon:yes stop_codon:yes gene_type:complete
MIDEKKYDLKYYRTFRDAKQRHVNDLQQMYNLVNSQLHMAKLNLEAIKDIIIKLEMIE